MQVRLIFILDVDGSVGGRQINTLRLSHSLSPNYNSFILVNKSYREKLAYYIGPQENIIYTNSNYILNKWRPLEILSSFIELFAINRRLSKRHKLLWISQDMNHELLLSGFGLWGIGNRLFIKRGSANQFLTGIVLRNKNHLKSVVAVSNAQKKEVCSSVDEENIAVIPNFIEYTDLIKVDRLSLYHDIVIAGYFNENKNQKFAIELIEELILYNRGYRLHFYGKLDNSDKASTLYLLELQLLVNSKGLENYVIFHDFVYNQIDIYNGKWLTLSVSKSEGFGMTLVESQSYGIPVLSSFNGGSDDILVGELEEYLLPFDTRVWVRKIEELRLDVGKYNRLVRISRKNVYDRFRGDIIVKQWVSHLDNICSGF